MKFHLCAAVLLFCGLALAQDEDEEVTSPEYRELLRGPQLTQKQKDNIVDLHNKFRQQQGASNMKEVKWSNDLEEFVYSVIYECQLAAWQIQFMSDGQNEFSAKRTSMSINETIAVQDWFAEKENDIDGTTCQEGTECRHYWNAAYSGVTRVGCAVTFCPTLDYYGQPLSNEWLFSCVYRQYRRTDRGTDIDDLYKVGEACSECDQDQFVCNEGLCAEKEQ